MPESISVCAALIAGWRPGNGSKCCLRWTTWSRLLLRCVPPKPRYMGLSMLPVLDLSKIQFARCELQQLGPLPVCHPCLFKRTQCGTLYWILTLDMKHFMSLSWLTSCKHYLYKYAFMTYKAYTWQCLCVKGAAIIVACGTSVSQSKQ